MKKIEFNLGQQDYEAPSIRVIEVDPSSLICTSDGTEQYTRNMDPDIF